VRIARAMVDGSARRGEIDDESFHPFRSDLPGEVERDGSRVSLDGLTLLAPVVPSKVLVVLTGFLAGRDRETARAESPTRFSGKLTTSVCGSGADVVAPRFPDGVDYPMIIECELAVVIGKRSRRLTPAEAADAILGFTVVNDIGLRRLGRNDKDFTRSKGFDTFCPIGPWLTTDLELGDIERGLAMTTRVNGEIRQSGTTADFNFGVAEVIAEASQYFTLLPDDVISLGTPPPPPEVVPGDELEVEVESVGVLRNRVTADSQLTVIA
jgi:2-keto-4-pentenoate hydratase/2-oxohepta-3-ene-1,7-dioic acid hydratase in catechol pathway